MFSFTRFCLRVLADLNEIIRRMKRNVILTIAIAVGETAATASFSRENAEGAGMPPPVSF